MMPNNIAARGARRKPQGARVHDAAGVRLSAQCAGSADDATCRAARARACVSCAASGCAPAWALAHAT
jgi:hypothetical protein